MINLSTHCRHPFTVLSCFFCVALLAEEPSTERQPNPDVLWLVLHHNADVRRPLYADVTKSRCVVIDQRVCSREGKTSIAEHEEWLIAAPRCLLAQNGRHRAHFAVQFC